MRTRLLLPLVVFGLACCVPPSGPGGHLVAPVALAVALAAAWPELTSVRAALALAVALLLAQAVRMGAFDGASGGAAHAWRFVSAKAYFLLALSLASELCVGVMAFAWTREMAMRVKAKRTQQP